LCPGHLQRWVHEGRPDIDEFAALTDPGWRRQRPNQRCRVSGCGYGSARGGMCQLHAQRWERAGRPDLGMWLAAPPAVKQPEPDSSCRIDHCTLWPQAALPFCHTHANTWKVNGRPEVDEFVRRFAELAPTADETIRLDQLDAQLKLEMQYVLQARHDERRGKVTPTVVMRVVRLLACAPVASVTDYDEHAWRQHGRAMVNDSRSRGFLSYAYRKVADLAEAGGWEAEYPRDVWQLRRLGFEGGRTLRFDGIPQRWLRELAKRWTRWRLSSGLGLEAAARPVRVITRFAQFLDKVGVDQIQT
jgi:hypothetical protein